MPPAKDVTPPRQPLAHVDVSLCMIVRDEARRLGRCLASALPWVGEAIVVDTGSVDGTADIARAAGARVLHFAWCDDFSRARNHALDAATRPWALVLDADEVLVVDDAPAWARALGARDGAANDGAACARAAYSIDCHDRLDDGGVAVGPVLRLYRRDLPDMRYRGEVHEQIVAVAERRCATAHARFLHIEHDGHTGAVVAEHRTVERNLALARKLVASRPEDPFAWFCLAQAAQAHEPAGGEALAAFEAAAARLDALGPAHRQESYACALWTNLCRALCRAGRIDQAVQHAERGLRDFPDAPDLRFLRGKLLLDRGDPESASRDFEACLTPAAGRFFLRQDPGACGFAARTQLAICRLKLGMLPAALETLRRAAASAPPAYHLPRLLLGTLLVATGAAAEAEPILRAVVEQRPGDAEARAQWERALAALGRRRGSAPIPSSP